MEEDKKVQKTGRCNAVKPCSVISLNCAATLHPVVLTTTDVAARLRAEVFSGSLQDCGTARLILPPIVANASVAAGHLIIIIYYYYDSFIPPLLCYIYYIMYNVYIRNQNCKLLRYL